MVNKMFLKFATSQMKPGAILTYDMASYRKIWQSLEAMQFVFRTALSLWNLAGVLAALIPRQQSNFKVI